MPTILITRPEARNETLRSEFERLGATVRMQPTIELKPPESWDAVDAVIHAMFRDENAFDWLVFSSANGVDFFFDRVNKFQQGTGADDDFGFLSPVRIAVVGSGTDSVVQQRIGRRADVLPETFAAEGVLEHLLPEAAREKRFLLLRASRGRDILRRTLMEAGGIVTELVVYRSVDVEHADQEILGMMERGEFDWTTATSSAIARSLVRLFGESLRQTKIVSISPITSDTLRELGYPPILEAKTASMDGIVDVLKTVIRE